MVNDKWRPSHFEYLLKNFNKRTKELTSVNTKTKTKKIRYTIKEKESPNNSRLVIYKIKLCTLFVDIAARESIQYAKYNICAVLISQNPGLNNCMLVLITVCGLNHCIQVLNTVCKYNLPDFK
jgi:hypothetical protein